MMHRIAILGMLALSLLLPSFNGYGQTKTLKPGFNFFSKDQDIQLGREAAAQVEREIPVLNNPEMERWLNELAKPLIAQPEAGDYPYTFKWVNDPNINAFALPGGPIYMNTGLLLHSDNEGQVVGVLGHEIGHVALRHGTNQVSRANLFTLPAMIGAAALGDRGILGQLSQLGVGLGLNGVLMKYSRGAETQSDQLGALLLHRAGYNPIEMANFFEKLQAMSGNRNGVAAWFSSHPNPGNRVQTIQKEILTFDRREYKRDSGQFARMKAMAGKLPPPPAAAKPGQGGQPGAAQVPIPAASTIEAPSTRGRTHSSSSFEVAYPENWQVSKAQQGEAVTIAPSFGQVQLPNGQGALGYGSMFNVRDGNQNQRLEEIAAALEQEVVRANPGLEMTEQPMRITVDGRRAVLYMLAGPGPYQNVKEIVVMAVVERNANQVATAIFVAPERDYNRFEPTFKNMLRTLKVR
ncbi:MAG: M48 family metallopeptidase [Bryobacterales bacterium]|nr:M48 family metallopeptidase [Bryobacterales bacterium]